MSEYLSGVVESLSGRVFDLEKQIIGLPNRSDFAGLSQSHTSRFNSLASDLASISSKLDDVFEYIINLKVSLTSLEEDFVGHTGDFVYGLSGAETSGAHV